VDASLYGERDTAATRARLQALIAPMKDHLDEACMGQISEIFDGDAPHAPRGCPAQAWSAAEVLRAWRRLNAAKPRASNTAERAAAKVPS
jgi:4-alpha-glucanotransferase